MIIITSDDVDFPFLLNHLEQAKEMATLIRDGKVLTVRASRRFVLLSESSTPAEVSVIPVRSMSEAEIIARSLVADSSSTYGEELEH